jgi:hypothetical protein
MPADRRVKVSYFMCIWCGTDRRCAASLGLVAGSNCAVSIYQGIPGILKAPQTMFPTDLRAPVSTSQPETGSTRRPEGVDHP